VNRLIDENSAILSDPSKTDEEKDAAHRVFLADVYNVKKIGSKEITDIVDKYNTIYLNAYTRMVKRVSTITGYVQEK
jgi:hypothetical protein